MQGHTQNTPDIMTENTDTSNFFKTTTENEKYWEEYLAARPKYTEEFYARILEYYRSHQKDFESKVAVAHDVGSGPGQVAAVLSQHFQSVVASDLNESHLAVAKQRHAQSLDEASRSKISFEQLGAEAIHTTHPTASASFVAAAECMALLDPGKAFASWGTVLRPSGTLAIWFYGRPHFVSAHDYDAAACQKIYNQIADAMFVKHIKTGAGPAHKAGWKRATDCMTSFLDNVFIDPEQWTDVQRWKWNTAFDLPFYGPEACDFEIEVVNRVQPSEKVDEINDPSFWGESWTVEDWKLFLKMNLPTFRQEDISPDVEALWKKLEDAMGGPNVQRTTGWPVVAILATKK